MNSKRIDFLDPKIEKYAHIIIYYTKTNRLSTAVNLYEGANYFLNTVTQFKKLDELKLFDFKKFDVEKIKEHIFEYSIDSMKIIAGFENYMKGVLLEKGYAIHLIRPVILKRIKQEQKNVPIDIEKIFTNKSFENLDKKNDRDFEISDKTITMSSMLSPEYQKIIGLDSKLLKIVNEMNDQRNKVHFQYKRDFKIGPGVTKEYEHIISFRDNTIKKELLRVHSSLKGMNQIMEKGKGSLIIKPTSKEVLRYGKSIKGKKG